ncbi:mCG1044559 [Mus musculus]|jgi:hypothetical protein|nr:mCG1044559 [Mus musculus]
MYKNADLPAYLAALYDIIIWLQSPKYKDVHPDAYVRVSAQK